MGWRRDTWDTSLQEQQEANARAEGRKGQDLRGPSRGRLRRKEQERHQEKSWEEGLVGWLRAAGIQEEKSIE